MGYVELSLSECISLWVNVELYLSEGIFMDYVELPLSEGISL